MAISYPHKQTILVVVVCLLALTGAWFYAHSNKAPENALEASIAVNAPSAVQNTGTTTPSTDWQKDFFGVSNASAPILRASSSEATDEGPLTLTDRVGREFFTKYIQLRQANLLSNKDVVGQTSQDLVTATFNANAPRTYSSADIRIINDNDAGSLNQYSQSVTQAINMYTFQKGESAIIDEYMTKNDPKTLRSLDPIIAAYKRIIASLAAAPVPSLMQNDHLDLMNSLSMMQSSAEDLRVSDADSVRMLSGVSKHIKGATKLIDTIVAINTDLKPYDIPTDFNPNIWDVMLK